MKSVTVKHKSASRLLAVRRSLTRLLESPQVMPGVVEEDCPLQVSQEPVPLPWTLTSSLDRQCSRERLVFSGKVLVIGFDFH